jgi:hypothetical protein
MTIYFSMQRKLELNQNITQHKFVSEITVAVKVAKIKVFLAQVQEITTARLPQSPYNTATSDRDVLTLIHSDIQHGLDRTETCGRPGQANNLAPLT